MLSPGGRRAHTQTRPSSSQTGSACKPGAARGRGTRVAGRGAGAPGPLSPAPAAAAPNRREHRHTAPVSAARAWRTGPLTCSRVDVQAHTPGGLGRAEPWGGRQGRRGSWAAKARRGGGGIAAVGVPLGGRTPHWWGGGAPPAARSFPEWAKGAAFGQGAWAREGAHCDRRLPPRGSSAPTAAPAATVVSLSSLSSSLRARPPRARPLAGSDATQSKARHALELSPCAPKYHFDGLLVGLGRSKGAKKGIV